ncbi:MAG: hypothetical protein HY000_42245 [Planctomycetes bacterium]|nr:hypothetical protein [Planctomycetota bacterium]
MARPNGLLGPESSFTVTIPLAILGQLGPQLRLYVTTGSNGNIGGGRQDIAPTTPLVINLGTAAPTTAAKQAVAAIVAVRQAPQPGVPSNNSIVQPSPMSAPLGFASVATQEVRAIDALLEKDRLAGAVTDRLVDQFALQSVM